MCEILAPAGDKNSAIAAINSGADAIYLGMKQFSARSSAENFGYDELKEIVRYAALFGVKVHVAMNTLVKQDEADRFIREVGRVWECGADAVIIQDIFIGRAIHERYPQIVLHLSTQAGTCNEYGARLAARFGFSRVILARETSFEDIKKIASFMETEVFVQGALCTCFSGQCYLSSFAGGNSGNRGRCKQPCRKQYSIDRAGFDSPAYRISPSDLCVGEDILKLKQAGVYSFKIEGRMRRPEYVAAAVGHYRSILGGGSGDISALRRTYNRGNYTRGLAFGQDKTFLSSAVQGHLGEYVGTVQVVGGRYFCRTVQRFGKGDCFKILRSGSEAGGAVYDCDGKGGFYLACSARLKNGDKVFITTDAALNERLLSQKRSLNIRVDACFKEGDVPRIWLNGLLYEGTEALCAAENHPLSREDVIACFKKTDKLPAEVAFGEVEIAGRPYMGMAKLNALRRGAYDAFVSSVADKRHALPEGEPEIPQLKMGVNNKTAVICTDLRGVKADIGILKLDDLSCDVEALTRSFNGEKFLFMPSFLTGDEVCRFKKIAAYFDGIYSDGVYAMELSRELKKPLFAGTGFNVSNTFSASYLAENAKYFCISKELSLNEARPLCADNAFILCMGGIKVMDLLYCPFGMTCSSCDRRRLYTVTDLSGRKFPLRRYKTSACRFELYNCANLCLRQDFGAIADYTLCDAASLTHMDEEDVKRELMPVTRGHLTSPIL